MLPSMPSLMTPIRELGDDSSSSSDDSPTVIPVENGGLNENHIDSSLPSSAPNNTPEPSSVEPIQTQDEEQAQEKARTAEKRPSTEPTSAQKKKKKKQHKKILAALAVENGDLLDASAQSFAEAYFQKVKTRLDDEKWSQFVQELVSFEEKPEGERKPVELYRKMEILLSSHTDLIDEFLKFLLPHQALEVNRVMDFFSLDKMTEFFRKLNILLMKRQVRQVHTALESLTSRQNVSLIDVKESILPLIKSSPLLTNLFLGLLPGERPPDSLMTDFEQADTKEESECETIIVPDLADPYGTDKCICSCHQAQTRHCFACGIKYLNGRVYMQCGKSLRPAMIEFKDKKHLDLLKWEEAEKSRSRRRLVPKTLHSPGLFDNKPNADSEEDCGVNKKSPRTPRTRNSKPKVSKKETIENKEEVLDGIFPLPDAKADNNPQGNVDGEIKQGGADEHDCDEIVLENDCNTEEDEEEYLNKGVNSENESSIEAEDNPKDLECSFDEEVDDFDHSEIEICETRNDIQEERLKPNEDNNPKSESLSKTVDKIAGTTKVEQTELESSSKDVDIDIVKVEPMSVSSHDVMEKMEDVDQPFTEASYEIKTEVLEIVDVCAEQCAENVNPQTPSGSSHDDSSFKEWTKEEDKIILLTFQHESGLEQTFRTASLHLPNRTQEEIQQRFEVLLKLLKEMYPNNEPPT
ncbi:uncharacterized protein LOC128997313 [Macrosteles quadrilineatus]|uniref:uncharacterized protein LOC128997313 n=1 Tax=Macrosteles quadrilineatus TaxID=74068 RepID=UPI0023E2E8FB|nr:uncharacterized protein LOC128997313 [Macrosteles quadrilineatus]